MKIKSFILLCVIFALVVLVSSNDEGETSKEERYGEFYLFVNPFICSNEVMMNVHCLYNRGFYGRRT